MWTSFKLPLAGSTVFASLVLASTPLYAQDADADSEQSEAPARTFETYANENPAGEASGSSSDRPAPWRRIVDAEAPDVEPSYPYVEWHGYFRFRTESFWNLDLDTAGTSPILPPVESLLEPGTGTAFSDSEIPETATNEDGETVDVSQFQDPGAEHIGGANIRMRLRPTFHVTERARIHLEMNILDNVVMGSTPDGFNEARIDGGLRTDLPLIGFTRTQEPPNTINSGRDSISVTQAYAEVSPFFGTIRVGRMASHWGLGILANGGGSRTHLREPRTSYRGISMDGHTCMDCDFGDYVDRAMFITNLFNTYITVAWDYNYSGPTDINPDEYFGQPRELSNYDDVRSYIFALFQRPLRPEEIADRNRTLKELRRPTFDWGAYLVYRRQKLTAEGFAAVDAGNGRAFNPYDYNWWVRGATAFIPDFWFRLQHEPAFRERIRLEGEFVGILGSIENAGLSVGYDQYRERTIRQFGGALEFEYVKNALATGINAGFATGRTIDDNDEDIVGFGVIDQFSFNDSEQTLSNFQFDRNYFVDMIMFREIIGTVTNAYYFNPFFQYELWAKQADSLGVRFDIIGGMAMNPETTPSGNGFYGVETDLTVFYRQPRFSTQIAAGVYIPGSAFDGTVGRPRLSPVGTALGQTEPYTEALAASAAWTLQSHFLWAF